MDPAGAVNAVREGCNRCLRCVGECAFLERYGAPGAIAEAVEKGDMAPAPFAYECSLCRLCQALCPEGLSPPDMFLFLRGRYLADNPAFLKRYAPLLRYEALGSSRLLCLHMIPPQCETVFFPGCNLPGTRPDITEKLYREISRVMPRPGLILDCCNRHSHDLGRVDFFRQSFGEKMARLISAGIRKIITVCPNCQAIFHQYAPELEVIPAYQLMAEHNLMPPFPEDCRSGKVRAMVHDPCALRFDEETTGAVRKLLAGAGVLADELPHAGEKTLCCGEGGAVERIRPEFSRLWGEKIRLEAGPGTVITACGGCAGRLSSAMKTIHLLDLWNDPECLAIGNPPAARSPITYLNRFLLKRRMAGHETKK